jgi:transposase-like protein
VTLLPPHCPNRRCEHHHRPGSSRFFRRKGAFARSGDRRVARFQCKACGKHFSEQTFSPDYRDKKPEIEPAIRRLAAAGYSIRRTARLLGINRKTAARRMARLRSEGPARGPGA